jgi:hypothetical protein
MARRWRSRRQQKQKLARSVQTVQSWEVKSLQRIYRLFEKACGGADGGVVGLNGSINPFSLYTVLKEMDIGGRNFVDFGAGQGRALISAIMLGAMEAFGVELPQNMNHQFVFNAVQKLMTNLGLNPLLLLNNAEWHPEDIDNVIFFLFWMRHPVFNL